MLLDTHALYWLVSGTERLSDDALVAIGESQDARTLYVSPVTAWELALAVRKPRNAPRLGEAAVGTWFREALRETTARLAAINQRIAIEAAEFVTATGHKDPGDCYLIATARVRKLAIITRDDRMSEIAAAGYLEIVRC